VSVFSVISVDDVAEDVVVDEDSLGGGKMVDVVDEVRDGVSLVAIVVRGSSEIVVAGSFEGMVPEA
jgi:hypothetical protein